MTCLRSLLLASALLFPACSSDIGPDEDPIVIDLRGELGDSDVSVVGVTVAPDSGKRYMLDSRLGVYEIDPAGNATLLLARFEFPSSEVPPVSPFTDITALGENRFALTARDDGFLLDLGAHTLQQHFCYLPDDLPFDDVHQLTKSVAFDPASGLLFAQPQTISNADNSVVASSIGRFDRDSGEDLSWYPLTELAYIAGAMTVYETNDLLLGRDSTLSRYSLTTGELTESSDLDIYGVGEIAGLAIDRATNTLLIVDGASDELVELPLSVVK